MPPRQRIFEDQMSRVLADALPAIQEEINNEVERYQDAIQAWNEQQTQMFRRRIRMRRHLFLRIVNAVVAHDMYFSQTTDAVGRQSISTLQKCTSTIRQLAYGTTSDMFDEYLYWKNCPTAWRGQYTSGHKGTHPTIVLEAVADCRLWIWHAYFGVAGSNNDLNVLNESPLFNDLCAGRAPNVEFTANHRRSDNRSEGNVCPRQEAARKDVERAFGVLQARRAIVNGAARGWQQSRIADIMYACIIMHNMIVEDEQDNVTLWSDDPLASTGSDYVVTEPPVQGLPPDIRNVMVRSAAMRQEEQHTRLQADLIEEIWTRTNRSSLFKSHVINGSGGARENGMHNGSKPPVPVHEPHHMHEPESARQGSRRFQFRFTRRFKTAGFLPKPPIPGRFIGRQRQQQLPQHNRQGQLLPYGIDFPAGPTGRFTNGRNTADFLAELLEIDKPLPPYANATDWDRINGVNFGSGGAGILDESGQHFVRNEEKARKMLGEDVDLIVGDITKASTLLPEYFKGVKSVINAVSVIVGPKEGDTPDRAKYSQGIKFFEPEIKGDSPEMVEFIGMKNLISAVKESVGLRCGKLVFGFEDNVSRELPWGALDDVVMGGVSASGFEIDPSGGENGRPAGIFRGFVSTANNGGFASIRTKNFSIPEDLSAYDGLELRIKGDGRRYKFMLRTSRDWDTVAYTTGFDSVKDQWQSLMFSKFEYDGKLNPTFVEGPFQLPISTIRAYMKEPITPRFVHVSSAGVTRPDRPGLDLTKQPPAVRMNKELGFILTYKLKGEDLIRESGIPYTIIRPCALTEEPAGADLIFAQGDDITGKISREEVAKVCIAALESPYACDKTFESVIPFSEPYTVDPENPPPEKDYNVYFKTLKDGITGKQSLEQTPVSV
ncbi:hypothetical protein SASPL_121498 [Salvia splendens]|uniref:NADH:ubiquinone oxidoreductase intermediate-associated protein 30 domain-containing protein n=1 Tax=Salvia splendens TaxID=180675 RepID=A0A8X8ZUT8_SALSN|nr:hypothetical protein SASPL_121498 [Salvia splendens]